MMNICSADSSQSVQRAHGMQSDIYSNKPLELFGYHYTSHLDTFESKRYMLDVIEYKFSMWEKEQSAAKRNKIHAIALSGIRRIGKTTILQQMYNSHSDAIYISCDYNTDLRSILLCVKKAGIHLVLIDEACKLSESALSFLVSFVKSGSFNLFFVFTGSVASIIDDTAYKILDCDILNLPSITYMESLSWKSNTDVMNLLDKTRPELFDKWVLDGDFRSKGASIQYIQGVVIDTYDSYKKKRDYRSKCESKFVLGAHENSIQNGSMIRAFFEYVVLCQWIYIHGNLRKKGVSKPENIPLEVDMNNYDADKFQERFNSVYKLVNKYPRSLLVSFCRMLEEARLVERVDMYTELDNEELHKLTDELGVYCYVFEYPQMIYSLFNISLSSDIIDRLVELLILRRASYYYHNVGKYRTSDGTSEVDIIYNFDDFCTSDKGVIEVKHRPEKSVKLGKYADLNLKHIKEFTLSCSHGSSFREILFDLDSNADAKKLLFNRAYRVRNDLIVLLLEYGYMLKCYGLHDDRDRTLQELYDLYKSGFMPK